MRSVILKTGEGVQHALARLQTIPLLQGLRELGQDATMVTLPPLKRSARLLRRALPHVPSMAAAALQPLDGASHVFFLYNERRSAEMAREARKRMACKAVCFASDVYGIDDYVKLAEFVDVFLAPTRWHRDVIQSAVQKPVFHVPEAVDPVALPRGPQASAVSNANRLLWFGYPESFRKSLCHLLPAAFEQAGFDQGRFGIITAQSSLLLPGVAHQGFDPGSFYDRAQAFSYALLSHFCYDGNLNTIIKSPNKMVTSIVLGLVPLPSATPAYMELAGRYGLEALAYDGPQQLAARLRALDFDRDKKALGLDQVRDELMRDLAPARIAQAVMACL